MYKYYATALRVVDGDTVKLQVDCGFHISFVENFRLWGINAPEKNTMFGMESKAYLESLLYNIDGSPKLLYIESEKPDKYGRWLAKIWDAHGSATMINDVLVQNGFAVEYMRG